MSKSITREELINEISSVFSADMLPPHILMKDTPDNVARDINKLFLGKEWTSISNNEWRMTGLPVAALVRYIKPEAFFYYMPSLLLSSIKDNDYDYAIGALSPSASMTNEHGIWWIDYVGMFRENQKDVVRRYLEYLIQDGICDAGTEAYAREAVNKKVFG